MKIKNEIIFWPQARKRHQWIDTRNVLFDYSNLGKQMQVPSSGSKVSISDPRASGANVFIGIQAFFRTATEMTIY